MMVQTMTMRESRKKGGTLSIRLCRSINQWGSGTLEIIDMYREVKAPIPKWSEQTGSVMASFKPSPTLEVTPKVTVEVQRLLTLCIKSKSRKELQEQLGLKHDEHFRIAYLLPALENGYIERTIPDKPQSSQQQYRSTAKGRALMGGKNS